MNIVDRIKQAEEFDLASFTEGESLIISDAHFVVRHINVFVDGSTDERRGGNPSDENVAFAKHMSEMVRCIGEKSVYTLIEELDRANLDNREGAQLYQCLRILAERKGYRE